jgi:hypothetical protein
MADRGVHHVDDALTTRLDLVHVPVQVHNPVQRLRRRRDVVAVGGEDDDRSRDAAQIDALAAQKRMALRELVADEEVLDDPANLLLVHHEEAAPPTLEIEVALGLGVDGGVEPVELLPICVRRVEPLEVLDQQRSVEYAAAEVRHQQRRRDSADQPACVAHRIATRGSGPVGHRSAVDRERPDFVRCGCGEHEATPAALAMPTTTGFSASG